jgi:hypothetical protein
VCSERFTAKTPRAQRKWANRLQETGPQSTVHFEHCIYHLLGDLLNFVFRLIPSRSWRLRGEPFGPLDLLRA